MSYYHLLQVVGFPDERTRVPQERWTVCRHYVERSLRILPAVSRNLSRMQRRAPDVVFDSHTRERFSKVPRVYGMCSWILDWARRRAVPLFQLLYPFNAL